MTGSEFKNLCLTGIAALGGMLAEMMGGWDMAVAALVCAMAIDYITGMMVALIFHKSTKTKGGGASSAVGFKGICKKIAILMLIVLAHHADKVIGTECIRTAAAVFFIGNEGLSILENVGLMGIDYPPKMKKMLEVIKEKGDGDV